MNTLWNWLGKLTWWVFPTGCTMAFCLRTCSWDICSTRAFVRTLVTRVEVELTQGFSAWALLAPEAREFSSAVGHTVQYRTCGSNPSLYPLVARSIWLSWDCQGLQTLPSAPWRTKSCPVENHWTQLPKEIWKVGEYCGSQKQMVLRMVAIRDETETGHVLFVFFFFFCVSVSFF